MGAEYCSFVFRKAAHAAKPRSNPHPHTPHRRVIPSNKNLLVILSEGRSLRERPKSKDLRLFLLLLFYSLFPTPYSLSFERA